MIEFVSVPCGQVRSSFFSRTGMACQLPYGFELFDRIVLIYNPVNRRDPLTLAESMRGELDRRLPDVPAALQATQHAGRARELAQLSRGDGAAVDRRGQRRRRRQRGRERRPRVSGNQALTAVAAGGNANDRRRSTRRKLVAAGARNAGPPPIPTLTKGRRSRWTGSSRPSAPVRPS